MSKGSIPMTLNSIDVKKVLMGAVVAGLGAALLYILQWLGHLDFGIFGPAVAAVLAVLVNLVRKWLGQN